MAQNNNATCSICNRGYHVCLSCRDSINLAPWKVHTDTAEHYKVFQIIRGFSTNVYTKDEAKEKLKNVNLNDIESFRPHIKKIIEDIMKEEKPVEKSVKKIEESDVTEVAIEEQPVFETKNISKKRNNKVEVE